MAESVANEAKLIARHSVIYGLANVLDRIVGFVMLPVYTHFLTPADYGVMELIYLTTSLISLVIGLGVEAAVSRFYYDYKTDDERKVVISTSIIGYGIIISAVTLILLPFSGLMSRLVLDSPEYSSFFAIAILTLGAGFILPIIYTYMRVRQKSIQYMTTKVAMTVLILGMNIYFVVYAKQGVFGILLSNLLGQLAFMVVLGVLTLNYTGLKINYHLLKEMLKFGLPLIPSSISAYIVQASDRYFVKQYADLSATGLYSLGYKMGTLINQFVTSPFIQVWNYRRLEFFEKGDSEKIYARIFTYFCVISLFVGLLISLLAKEIIHFMADEAYWSAYKIVPIIVLSYIIFSFHYHFSVGIMMKKATKYIAYVNVANGIINLILNFILIKRYTIWGAAVATLLCFIFKVAMTYYYSNRIYKIQMEWRRIILLFMTAFAIYFMAFQIDTGSIWLDILVKSGIGICFPIILYITRFFTDEELKRFRHIVKTRKLEFD
jgi:O-antigen/teichoic acid export membrane protein